MSKTAEALYSQYVIDGVRQECTPFQLLRPLCANVLPAGAGKPGLCIIDETVDPPVGGFDLDSADIRDCLALVRRAERTVPFEYMDSYTRFRLALSLEDALWRRGHFRLGDLELSVSWQWNDDHVGRMASFYASVRAAADYADSLGISFSKASLRRGSPCSLSVRVGIDEPASDEEVVIQEPFRTENPKLSRARACRQSLVPDPESWVIYIPFDTADFRLGGSLLSQAAGIGGVPADISDADCFIDCFEVVREFVEDGLLLSGESVGEGGLLTTLDKMTSEECGLEADISALMHSYQEKHSLRPLFSEVPGVIVQIRDSDFDYLDAELLLQDVAYFPLGHPSAEVHGVEVKCSEKSGIQTILESLMRNAEGED